MTTNYFKVWLDRKENQFFWNLPLASEQLDSIISYEHIQKSIAASKSNQAIYAYIERHIVSDYSLLIDIKLREAFKKLQVDDFKDPSGFERKIKSNLRQQNYFQTRQHLEFFIINDITHNETPDGQLNALRRWIDISNTLLNRQCYEGFLLIFVNLQLIAKPHLLAGLPETSKKIYHHLLELSSPNKNHSSLRHHMQSRRRETEQFPLLFWYHAIIVLNESIQQANARTIQLTELRDNLNKKIHQSKVDTDPLKLKTLRSERNQVHRELKAVLKSIQDQLSQRDGILNEIKTAQAIPTEALPLNMDQTYNQLKTKYSKFQIEEMRNQYKLNTPKNGEPKAPELYHSKLLPSFWSRRGKSSEKYWEELFSPSLQS